MSADASAGVGNGVDIAPTPSTSSNTSNSPNENTGLPTTPITATTLHPDAARRGDRPDFLSCTLLRGELLEQREHVDAGRVVAQPHRPRRHERHQASVAMAPTWNTSPPKRVVLVRHDVTRGGHVIYALLDHVIDAHERIGGEADVR